MFDIFKELRGYHYECTQCDSASEAYYTLKEALDAAKQHANETGHIVDVFHYVWYLAKPTVYFDSVYPEGDR